MSRSMTVCPRNGIPVPLDAVKKFFLQHLRRPVHQEVAFPMSIFRSSTMPESAATVLSPFSE